MVNISEFKQPSQQVNVFTYSTPKPVDGYFFTYVINNDDKFTYSEETNYTAFEGCNIVDFHNGIDNCNVYSNSYKL